MWIRLALEADVPMLQHLYTERMALLLQSDRRIASEAVEWAGRRSGAVWVGEMDGRVGGYISVWQRPGAWLIDHMALDAHTYFPGLARGLVSEVRNLAQNSGAESLLACVPQRHPVEQAFWRALGAKLSDREAPAGCEWMQLQL